MFSPFLLPFLFGLVCHYIFLSLIIGIHYDSGAHGTYSLQELSSVGLPFASIRISNWPDHLSRKAGNPYDFVVSE